MEPRTEDDGDTDLGRVVSPEEVAREFLREGGGVARQERNEEGRRRRARIPARVATAAGIAGAVAVLVLLAVVALLPSHPPSAPRATGVALPHPTPAITSTSTTTSSSTIPLLPPASVTVDVLNAYGSGPLAPETALRLISAGFAIRGTGNAPSLIAGDNPSEIFYGPSGRPAAQTLAQWLHGPIKEIPSANLSGNNLELWIANPLLGVTPTTTTTTTISPVSSPPPAP